MNDFLKLGTTTLEAKSGYGLDLDSELKSLAILDEVNSEHKSTLFLPSWVRMPFQKSMITNLMIMLIIYAR